LFLAKRGERPLQNFMSLCVFSPGEDEMGGTFFFEKAVWTRSCFPGLSLISSGQASDGDELRQRQVQTMLMMFA
jgi:hypothetical protein